MALRDEILARVPAEVRSGRNAQAIADVLNTGRTRIVSRTITERDILAEYPDGPVAGDAVLRQLESFGASAHPLASVVRRAVGWLSPDKGIDIGHASTRALLEQLVAGGVLTAEAAAKLKSLAVVPDPLSEFEVRCAIWSESGDYLV